MPARQSAGDMIRSVSYAANSVGGAAFQLSYTALWTSQFTVFGEEFSGDSRKTPLTLDVPLASASRYHTIDMQRILRAFTRQTKMREPQRQLATGIHPCWRSLTILTPDIPRPRQGAAARRLGHTDINGGCGGLRLGQSSPAASGRGDQEAPEFEITEEREAGAPEDEVDQEEFELFHDNEEYHHDASDEPGHNIVFLKTHLFLGRCPLPHRCPDLIACATPHGTA